MNEKNTSRLPAVEPPHEVPESSSAVASEAEPVPRVEPSPRVMNGIDTAEVHASPTARGAGGDVIVTLSVQAVASAADDSTRT